MDKEVEVQRRFMNRAANLVTERDELSKCLERAEITIGKLVLRVVELEVHERAMNRIRQVGYEKWCWEESDKTAKRGKEESDG